MIPMILVVGLQVGAAAPVEREAAVHTLSSRDPVGCGALEASVETLREIVQTVSMPPWVPMRAAQCMIEGHAQAVEGDLAQWVLDPESQGLGLLVLGQLDRLPEELAVRLARLALTEGPAPERAARRILVAERASVRALVQR